MTTTHKMMDNETYLTVRWHLNKLNRMFVLSTTLFFTFFT